jgi:thioredoxin
MNQTEFEKRLAESRLPVVVDIWADWCAPCRVMEPAFKQISEKYAGQVEVIKIDADKSQEVVKALKVLGIPTVLAFANGEELVRRTGVQSVEALDILFDAARNERKPVIMPPTPMDRLLRSMGGLALILIGWLAASSTLLVVLGGLLLFSAFYDRCPIFMAIVPRITALFRRSESG